ncbi:hypothetical protein HYFRA_00010302 [Hymenoscyphus fraxineus]|uniref:Major facilitator superfamily (MFS) profile domain-containing protein n=1 Tax=Hymenoscyphus fraxineus TaxID=746836 RepID=A0A9N9KWZ3_9HELO|nr:hypothetical protein HYFRA_00010302 [Hymenoscyphus fraxineus]
MTTEDSESFELKDAGESAPFIPSSDSEYVELKKDGSDLQMDVGLLAWTQCAASFCLSMGTWGVGNSYGVFQTYYVKTFPELSPSTISWIGSIQLSVEILLGTIVGPLYDYGYLRSLVFVGCFLSVLGMILTSFSTQYWQLVFSQGVLVGIGNGCLFIPSFAVLPNYFEKKRALAVGIAQSGSALGGIFFPMLFRALEPRIGFRWTVQIFALIMFTIFILPVLGLRMRFRPSEARKLLDLKAWTELPFFLTGLCFFMLFLGVDIPAFYIQLYGIRKHILSDHFASYLLPLLNTGSLFGRIIPSYIADQAGVFNITAICILLSGILGFTWIGVGSIYSLLLFAVVFGFFSGAISSLSLNLTVALSPDPGLLGVRLGMLLIPSAMGLLLGNPIAGALDESGKWVRLQLFTGGVLVVAAGLVVIVRVLLYGKSWKKKC